MSTNSTIDAIGQELVLCPLNCEGVRNEPKKGIIPRCLVHENREGTATCIVVGLNPGKSKKRERNYYIEHQNSYQAVSDYFQESGLKNIPYFKRTREMITLLGFDGNILWTDLAKCECAGNNGSLPIQTLRVCINRFLRREIDGFKATTIFALGKVAFNFCALSFPGHFIVGLPHPSGSYGDFYKLSKRLAENPQKYIKVLASKRDAYGNCMAVQLSNLK